MTERVVKCEHFKPRQRDLWMEVKDGWGPCRYHRGGPLCTCREVFMCDTNGYAAWPWRADSDEDGEE